MLTNNKKNHLLLLISLVCMLYGYLISLNGIVANNITSIIFIISLVYIYFKSIKIFEEDNSDKIIPYLLSIVFCVNFFIIIGVAIAGPSDKFFWVPDSYDMHIPGSVRIMEIIKGESTGFVRSSIYDRTYIAHLVGSIFFLVFGVNPIASALSLLIPKVICAYFIFKSAKELFGVERAKIALILYALLPTAIFYTTTFYKEAPVQMLISMIYYLIIKSFYKIKIKYVISLIILFVFLGNERHYLLPCFAAGAILFAFLSKQMNLYLKISVFLACIVGYWIFTSYYYDIDIPTLSKQLKIFQAAYSNYSDVDSINRTIPYPLGILKLLLSPFVTAVKIKTYTHHATLITWGSIVHHVTILFFSIGLWNIWREKIHAKLMIVMILPFIIFMLVFGYVAPYNGRLRDSFLPFIVIVASVGIKRITSSNYFKSKFKKLTQRTSSYV